jgi:hypothetical protein
MSARVFRLRDIAGNATGRKMVAGVGFEPTTCGPGPVKPGRKEECQPGFSGLRKIAGNAAGRKMVAGVGFEPTTSGL